jgi:hypothetical protein
MPWEKQCIEAPTVVQHDGKLFMFYAGAFNNEPQQIGVAVSTNALTWKRLPSLRDEPFMANGQPGSWNSSESGHPGVFTDANGQTYLFYQGNNDHGKTWHLSWVKIAWNTNGPSLESR